MNQEAPTSIPNNYYTDASVFSREVRQLWHNYWQIVGRVEDLAKPGDYLTCTIGDEPIVVTHAADGRLRAMHNVCAHRGMKLAEGQGNFKRLYCPYHGWTYD